MNTGGDTALLLRSLSGVNLLIIGAVILGAWVAIAVSSRTLTYLTRKVPARFRFYLQSLIPVLRLVFIALALVLIVTSVIDPTIENLMVLLGALGLGLGFAFKDYVASLIAGVVTLYEGLYRPGDWVEINGAYGKVKAINMRSAEIITPDDTVVIIPHQKIWDHLIFNANDGSQNLQCVADFHLQPQHDAALVKQILYDVALTSAYLQMKLPINVVVSEKPWGTHYRLKAYPVEPGEQFNFVTDLTIRGKAALNKRKINYAAVLFHPEIKY